MATLKRRYVPKQVRNDWSSLIYKTHKWHELSRQFRKRNPICVRCKANGITQKAECVDHIKPISEGGSPWDVSNLQSLCISCNSKKRHGK